MQKSPIKTLNRVNITKKGNLIEITFVSKSFLQQQVRSMVGWLKYLAEGKWTLSKFKEVIISKRDQIVPQLHQKAYFW